MGSRIKKNTPPTHPLLPQTLKANPQSNPEPSYDTDTDPNPNTLRPGQDANLPYP